MALDITYYFALDKTGQVFGICGPRTTTALTATSADMGAIPTGANYARLTAGEDTIVSNNGVDAGPANGQLIKTGAVIEMAVPTAAQFKARTA